MIPFSCTLQSKARGTFISRASTLSALNYFLAGSVALLLAILAMEAKPSGS